MSSHLIFEQAWYYVALCIVAALIPALWLYFKNKRNSEASSAILRLLFIVRFASFFICLLLLLSIFLKSTKTEKEEPLIVLAIDNSSSVIGQNDTSITKNLLKTKILDLKKALEEKFLVKTLLFGAKTRLAEIPDFNDAETDMDDLIKEVDNNFGNQNVGAVVVFSDGIYNKGGNPVYSAEKSQFPIWSVGLGDTTEQKDVWIQKVNHNEVVNNGNNFPVEIQINALKCGNQKVVVGIYQGDKKLQTQELLILRDNFSSICNFTLSTTGTGLQRYSARVSVLENEINLVNNQFDFVVDVINQKEKIALISMVPHPDIEALREVIINKSSAEISQFQYPNLPNTVKGFNLVIIQSYSKNSFDLLNKCKTEKVPYWIINPETYIDIAGLKLESNLNRQNDVEPVLVENFGNFSLSPELHRFISEMPAVKCAFGQYESANGNQNLLVQRIGVVETSNPLLVFNEQADLKSAVFTGDGLWRWKMTDFVLHKNTKLFSELVGKTMQYLAVKNDKSFFRISGPKILNENQNMELQAEVYNKSYEAVTEPEVSLELMNAAGKKFQYAFSKLPQSYRLDLGQLSPGDYQYTAKVKYNNDLFEKQGRFAINRVLSEKLGGAANHGLLRQISNGSGGKFYKEVAIKELQTALLKSEKIKPITYAQSHTAPLVDLKYLFWLLIILLSLEWFIRKRFFTI